MQHSDFDPHFFYFQEDISDLELPVQFNYPFVNNSNPLCQIAANEVWNYLENQDELDHNFGLDGDNDSPIGKMFGILLVKYQDHIGYLTAASGKLGDTQKHRVFVPPVYDILQRDSFFIAEKEAIEEMTSGMDKIENDETYIVGKWQYELKLQEYETNEKALKQEKHIGKIMRNAWRKKAALYLNSTELVKLNKKLDDQSVDLSRKVKRYKKKQRQALLEIESKFCQYEEKLKALKEARKLKSNTLQNEIFTEFIFLNSAGEKKSLLEIFSDTYYKKPPAGAGECAGPKLLQYAFKNHYQPLSLAEFWWGVSPSTEIRKHKHFYPACSGKCKPIFSHMLQGIDVEKNPLLVNHYARHQALDIVYEDSSVLVVNKPPEMLSVPGKTTKDSVLTRLVEKYGIHPNDLITHRLDMSTSGIMICAKNKKSQLHIQKQFRLRRIRKIYHAVLEGRLDYNEGTIKLPLRGDFYDRPRQMVCYKHGKETITYYRVLDTSFAETLVQFIPLTGRTHQLRVHAAHISGLNCPIKGDDLYGKKNQRLYLHAQCVTFTHPATMQEMKFEIESGFSV